jgi:aspartate aminotransferase-like enzyme/predicted N-acetyltransferase YhbS
MYQDGGYLFKRAETTEEFEQIHRLNHRTFVAEMAQHHDPGDGRLVDKFHAKNIYFIAVKHDQVIGMISIHDRPPFSVADRLPDPSILTRPDARPIEVRLLAVAPEHRNSTVMMGLVCQFYEYTRGRGYTHAYISGVEERLPLYRTFGFEPLGPAVSSGGARFVPMGTTISQLVRVNERRTGMWRKRIERIESSRREPVCLLPGPVSIGPAVHAAFHQPPIYHRGPEFTELYENVRRTLAVIANGRDVAILNGSGTAANEVVAATVAAGPQPGSGVMLVNGEFGARLARQASRFGLTPRVLTWAWGKPWDLEQIDEVLANEPAGSWIWGVHQESSTGVLNDLPGLVELAQRRGIRVCVDCISSLGAVALDLSDVYLATAASGKSLGAYAGAAIIFADARQLADLDISRVPSYFDLPAALSSTGTRYTFPSPTLLALDAALSSYATPEQARVRYDHYAALGVYVRGQLRRLGLGPLAAEYCAAPVITTFAPPENETAEAFVARCHFWGYALGGQSGYLAERRLVQIATMGAVTRDLCAPLFTHLENALVARPALATA